MRGGVLLAVAAVAAAGCVRQRDIFAPVPGAVERTLPDTSVNAVLDAAVQAITDRGLSVAQIDRERGFVESVYADIAAIRSDIDAGTAMGIERNVRFRFRAIPSFGAINLYGEAVYQLGDFGGRASERMVPEAHPARRVLGEMIESVIDGVAQARAARNPPPPAR
jgi:hypothetical protein